ncbi:DUF4395 domain-containing protein [Pseudoclavibacter chungangensis]|uniref:DUF4395 domain-containing protein n=1 Tax=Pseudoclavibacter chungangensis TaxID=587635 RepID=A0A7J5BP16_9MICO|nr:DUF4395 domain-containing protein [Pseudoclavibacter chungangensis]KAB1654274.1 DUF4395 domain-containing protein [Pseudoclavibacter chungangensis]NYJ65322.1 hypothetical protein [Pseudoclavibacter chungangensis]
MSSTAPTSTPRGIDPRGPRFAAWITSALLVVGIVLALTGVATRTDAGRFALPSTPLLERALDPGFLVLLVVALLFAWSLVSPRTQPWSALFRTAVAPRLAPPTELEDPRPPRFAQLVGLLVVGVGLLLHLLGVPLALPIAAGAAFAAAFLNASIGFCLGCELYLLLVRAGLLGRARPGTA